jgi:hypothetical protein
MRQYSRFAYAAFGACLLCALVTSVGCATTTSANGDDDDSSGPPDAHVGTPADAPPGFPDARSIPDAAPGAPDAHVTPPPIDASIPGTPDAGGGGLFCTGTSMCNPGTCCFKIVSLCVPGSEPIPGLCIPMDASDAGPM